MTFEEYRKLPAMNWSSLVAMAESPAMFAWLREHPRESTPSLTLGTAIHSAILQPDEFERQYITRPWRMNLSTKEGREWKAQAGDRHILAEFEGETIGAILENLGHHDDAMAILADTDREAVLSWTDAETGVECKARVDALGPDRLVELKSTRSLRWFSRDVATYRYLGQLAWYLDGAIERRVLQPDAKVCVVAVETKPPFGVAVFSVQQHQLMSGRVLYRRLLNEWVECERAGCWPGLFPTLTDLEVDEWGLEPDEDVTP